MKGLDLSRSEIVCQDVYLLAQALKNNQVIFISYDDLIYA
jgi:hypothetical protein